MGIGEQVENVIDKILDTYGTDIVYNILDGSQNTRGEIVGTVVTSGTVTGVPSNYFKKSYSLGDYGYVDEGGLRYIFQADDLDAVSGTTWEGFIDDQKYAPFDEQPIYLAGNVVAIPVNFKRKLEDA